MTSLQAGQVQSNLISARPGTVRKAYVGEILGNSSCWVGVQAVCSRLGLPCKDDIENRPSITHQY